MISPNKIRNAIFSINYAIDEVTYDITRDTIYKMTYIATGNVISASIWEATENAITSAIQNETYEPTPISIDAIKKTVQDIMGDVM